MIDGQPRRVSALASRAMFAPVFMLLLLFGEGRATGAPPDTDPLARDFETASQEYVEGRYDRALSLFEGLVVAGWRNGPLFFNLGNTYFQLGELGDAIRAYRRAELFHPRDPDLRYNLAVARGQIGEAVGRTGPIYALRSLAFWYDLLSHREMAQAALAGWVLLCAAAVWRYATGSVASGAGLGAAALVFVALTATWGIKHYELTRVESAVVLNGEAEVRAGPGLGQAVSFTTAEGTEVSILGKEGAYHRIRRADGRQGWIRSDQLGLVALEEG